MTKVVLSENQKAASEVAGKVAKVKFSNTADKLDMYLPEENSFNVSLPGKEVESHFTEILRLDEQDFEDIQTAMVNLRSYLSDLSSSGNNQKIAYKSILDGTVTQDVAASFERARELLPKPFNQWLGELSQESVKFAENGSKDHLNQLWLTKRWLNHIEAQLLVAIHLFLMPRRKFASKILSGFSVTAEPWMPSLRSI